ncbi:hypothetical protein TNCV_5008441 [Trichonephila clavipes]|nr:hypothetical protein TNCV_5008441 [Trichonephila clavipes]
MFSGHKLTRVAQSTNSVEMSSQTVMTSQKSKMNYSGFSRSPRNPGRVLVQDCPVLVLGQFHNFHFKVILKGHIRKKCLKRSQGC